MNLNDALGLQALRGLPLGGGPQGATRLALFAKCPCGSWQLSDPDGILIDLAEA